MSLEFAVTGAPRKELGQHFLVDTEVVRRIIEAAQIEPHETVLEIGPGEAALTGALIRRAQNVVAVEIDGGLFGKLEQKFAGCQTLRLLNRDILRVSLSELAGGTDSSKLVVVANLPYYITSQVLFKLLDNRKFIERAILMVQREVAHRITATPGSKEYGMLSVMVQLRASPQALFDIPPECFQPKPQVHSTLLRLTLRDSPPVQIENEGNFFNTVKAAFGTRRKMLKNSLRSLPDITAESLETIAARTGIDLRRRAETLSLEEFASLSNAITVLLSSSKTATAKQTK